MNKFANTLGLLALTAPGAASCYQYLMSQALEMSQQSHNPEIIMYQPDAYDYMEDVKTQNWPSLVQHLLDALGHLKNLGADIVGIPVNTIHLVIDDVIKASPVRIINLLDVVVDFLKKSNYRQPLIIGTYPTMTQLYPPVMKSHGFHPVQLEDIMMKNIDAEIHDRNIS